MEWIKVPSKFCSHELQFYADELLMQTLFYSHAQLLFAEITTINCDILTLQLFPM